MPSIHTFRGGRRLAMMALLMSCLFLYTFHHGSMRNNRNKCHNSRSLSSIQKVFSGKNRPIEPSQPYYRNFNTLNASFAAVKNQERILVLTPLLQKSAIDHLPRYFELLDKSTYPNRWISIGLLIPTTTQHEPIQHIIDQIQRRWFHAFHSITLYQRDFNFDFDSSYLDIKYEPYRRTILARAKNTLLSVALRDDIGWVAWIAVDVTQYPASVFEDLIRHDVDVIVPNSILDRSDGSFWAYERNNWQETDLSMRKQMAAEDDFVMLEGYSESPTGRTLLVDMPTHLGKDHLVPLDSVGVSFTLVKAQVHREGANFPSYTLMHQVDTEGFARMVQAMGYGLFGLPSYLVYHASS